MKAKSNPAGSLKAFPEEQQAAIVEYAGEHSLPETIGWLADQGIQVAADVLAVFLSQRQVRQQLNVNAALVQLLLEELAWEDPTLSVARIQEVGQAFFSRMALANRDSDLWHLTQELELKRGRLDLDRHKFQESLEERKAAIRQELERARAGGGLTADTLERIEHELKLM
jgi:chaperonin cofactor prefoldin